MIGSPGCDVAGNIHLLSLFHLTSFLFFFFLLPSSFFILTTTIHLLVLTKYSLPLPLTPD